MGMNASSPLSDQTIFYWKRVTEKNPISDGEYQRLLGLNPTLGEEINRHVKEVLFTDLQELRKTDLNDNANIISESSIEQAKKDLIAALKNLEKLTKNPQSIVVIADDCFTNIRLLVLLKNILGKENYRRFIKVVQINYDTPANNDYLEKQLENNHTLCILGGSLSDTYSMHESHYDSPLAQMIKTISDEYAPRYINKRLVGVCFWQQYTANIIGKSRNSTGIIATLKWPAQFAPSTCTLQTLEYVKPIYRQALNGLSNDTANEKFTSAFTRSWYVSFDLLKTEWKLGVVPLIKDDATGGIVGWGSGNGNIMGVQFHPELSFVTKTYNTTKNIRKIAPTLSPLPEEQALFVNNFQISQQTQRDIGEAFYTYTMLAFIRDITEKYNQVLSSLWENNHTPTVGYAKAVQRLVNIISQRVNLTMQNHDTWGGMEIVIKWIDAVDREWRLLLNHQLDWKVSRSIDEISEILGIWSIVDLIQAHKDIQQSRNYIVRDLGAGDGSTLKELYERLSKQDIIFYGVGDYIYFDLFTSLRNTKYKHEIEEEVMILFVEKVVLEFRTQKGVSTILKIKKALERVTFSKNDTIRNSSMTNNKTLMFSSEHEYPLSQKIQDHFEVHLKKLEELKEFVGQNIYSLFSNFIQKIYVSQFNDLRINDGVISKIDFQYSIRSTSHVSGREYMNIISDYIYNSAKPGSIFIDNGIHESYTSIPRLRELVEVYREMLGVSFNLIYDKSTNYFCSVIITKDVEFSDEFWKPHLKDDNFLIVPLKEAYKSTFFQLEYFIRNFIISNFKNNIVFWNFNTQIIDALKTIMERLKEENTQAIPQIILDLINHIANDDEFKKKGVAYNSINMSILENYTLNGENLSTILGRKIYTPIWMNIDAKRNY